MGHGPGRFQRLILHRIKGGETQANRLAWDLALDEGEVGPGSDGRLSKSFVSKYWKALKSLDGRHLRMEERPLTTLDEFVDFYPHHTESARVRSLRQRVLPIVRDFLSDAAPRYDDRDQEDYLLGRLPERKAAAVERWPHLRASLLAAVRVSTDDAAADAMLLLRTAGDVQFLAIAPVSTTEAFSMALRDARPYLSSELLAELNTFVKQTWPLQEKERSSFKSLLYRAVDMRRGVSNAPVIQQELLLHLSKHPDPDVSDLVTHVRRHRLNGLPPEMDATQELRTLLLRDALEPFRFLRQLTPA